MRIFGACFNEGRFSEGAAPRTLEGSKFPANQFQSAAYLFA
jgi:hypothetical protein